MKPNLTRISLILLLALVAGGLAACGNGQAKVPDEKDEPPAIPVEVAAVSVGTITAFYSTTATLEAEREARVVPRLGGRIVELLVEEGDPVEAGQALARIDNERYQLELSRAEATLRRLEQDFNRSREMYARNLISSEAFERAKFDYDAQKAGFEIAFLELSYTNIASPIDGVVSERMVRVGNTVNTQDPVFVVTKMDPLRATLHVPERELARLQAGQVASVAVDALAGRRFEGRIARISPVVDPTTGTFRVTVEVNADGALMPGMFGRVHIVHDTRVDTLLIPVAAVLAEDARTTVFVVNEGVTERRDVRVGYRNNGSIEILEGLVAGELVVVTGQASLRNDSKVTVVSGGPTATEEEASTGGDE
ncbi:MAG: efflux RND transporter periplasmic adaptor subunit [Xanthomonadaceae bacterium]|nr:efflux RND transporter periplasmic adaptor subunit [Xanthomonadaceae bacterium]